jgi:hypothetical protein
MVAAMPTSFDTFRLPHKHSHSQFISYPGLPAPKPPSRRYNPKNARSTADEWHDIDVTLGNELGLDTKWKDRGVLATTSHGAEVVNLTCLGRLPYS